MNLQGQLVVVTGAAGGLGKAIADEFKERGAEVVGFDIVQGEGIFQADVTKQKDVSAFFGFIRDTKNGQPIDYFVGNAGVEQKRSCSKISHAEIQNLVAVNVLGNFLFYNELVGSYDIKGEEPRMANGGVIEIIGSAAAHGNRDQGFYAGTKTAVYGLALSHRKDPVFTERGVDLRIFEPALIETLLAKGTIKKIRRFSPEAETVLKEKRLWVSAEYGAREVVNHALGDGKPQILEFPYEGAIDDFRSVMDEYTPKKQ